DREASGLPATRPRHSVLHLTKMDRHEDSARSERRDRQGLLRRLPPQPYGNGHRPWTEPEAGRDRRVRRAGTPEEPLSESRQPYLRLPFRQPPQAGQLSDRDG